MEVICCSTNYLDGYTEILCETLVKIYKTVEEFDCGTFLLDQVCITSQRSRLFRLTDMLHSLQLVADGARILFRVSFLGHIYHHRTLLLSTHSLPSTRALWTRPASPPLGSVESSAPDEIR